MGQATRTMKLALDFGCRSEGGTNPGKQAYLEATVEVLNQARTFYVDFFLAHAQKLAERVAYFSEKHLAMRERAISAHELLTWAESCTVATHDHPHSWPGWNFSERFPDMPVVYRRSVIKDAIGKVRSYLSNITRRLLEGTLTGRTGTGRYERLVSRIVWQFWRQLIPHVRNSAAYAKRMVCNCARKKRIRSRKRTLSLFAVHDARSLLMSLEVVAAVALLAAFAALYGLLPTLIEALERRGKNKR